jgi:hypothetical protein
VLTDHAASVVVSSLLQPCQLAWAARVAFEERRWLHHSVRSNGAGMVQNTCSTACVTFGIAVMYANEFGFYQLGLGVQLNMSGTQPKLFSPAQEQLPVLNVLS